ncbi:MAG: hypothetical protein K2P84_03540 [Undibacterium sp.]|nr:hypothetical protein [Undibacterium sp.]
MFTIFLHVRATSNWLSLSRQQRATIFDQHVQQPIQASPALRMRYFDAEAFHARVSDVILIETEDLKAYYFFIENLKDSPIFSEQFFTLIDIIPSIENGFLEYEATLTECERAEIIG